MSTNADSPDRDQQILGELAELDLALARKVHACAMATDDPEQLSNLSRAYQRVSRSARQTLALKAKLARTAVEDRRQAEVLSFLRPPLRSPPPPPPPRSPGQRRLDEVELAVSRLIWSEREREAPEDDDSDDLLDLYERMDARLEALAEVEGFEDRPLDEQVAGICADLGLDLANVARWRDLEDPDVETFQEAVRRRSG